MSTRSRRITPESRSSSSPRNGVCNSLLELRAFPTCQHGVTCQSKGRPNHILAHMDAAALNPSLKQCNCLVEHIQSRHSQIRFGGRRHKQTHHNLRRAITKFWENRLGEKHVRLQRGPWNWQNWCGRIESLVDMLGKSSCNLRLVGTTSGRAP